MGRGLPSPPIANRMARGPRRRAPRTSRFRRRRRPASTRSARTVPGCDGSPTERRLLAGRVVAGRRAHRLLRGRADRLARDEFGFARPGRDISDCQHGAEHRDASGHNVGTRRKYLPKWIRNGVAYTRGTQREARRAPARHVCSPGHQLHRRPRRRARRVLNVNWSPDGRRMVFHRALEGTWPPVTPTFGRDPQFRMIRTGSLSVIPA